MSPSNEHIWTTHDIPDLAGRTAIVTGASSGLGFVAARELAARGAQVTLAVRNTNKGEARVQQIREENPGAAVRVARLDLADLASVTSFATEFLGTNRQLNILINNAGIMAVPRREETVDGFEAQFGTNHLGHFALTGQLMPVISATPGARIVNVSSNLHKNGVMNFDDLQSEKKYRAWAAYGQSKLANLLFTSELHRRLERAKVDALAVAAHPGWSATDLMMSGPMAKRGAFVKSLGRLVNRLNAQSVDMGALTQLYAATEPHVAGNEYFGPDGRGEMKGYPRRVDRSDRAKSSSDAERLWVVSEELTGVRYLDD